MPREEIEEAAGPWACQVQLKTELNPAKANKIARSRIEAAHDNSWYHHCTILHGAILEASSELELELILSQMAQTIVLRG